MDFQTYREELRRSGALNSYQRDRADVLLEFLPFNRSPVERIVVDLTNPQQFVLGPGFWAYVKEGCGHELVDITFKGQRDATNNTSERFGLATGEFFPWPFVDAVVNVPSGLSAGSTLTLWVARFPVPAPNVADVAQLHNRSSFVTGQKNVAVVGTPERLVALSTPIPEGFELKMKAKVDNTGRIFVGNSSANVLDAALRYSLEPGEPFPLAIDDIFKIWLDAEIAGEGVEFYYEAI